MEMECPECGAENEVDDPHAHELLTCWSCEHDYEYNPNFDIKIMELIDMTVKCIDCRNNKKTHCEADMWFEGDGDELTPEEIQRQTNSERFCSEYEPRVTNTESI